MYVLVVAISGGDVVATSVVAKSAPSKTHFLRTFVGVTDSDKAAASAAVL